MPWEWASEGCQAGGGRCFSSNKAHASMGKLFQGILGPEEQQKCCTESVGEMMSAGWVLGWLVHP